MNIDEAKSNVGKMVMSYDAGNKLIKSVCKPHGPYLLKQVTKSGMVTIVKNGKEVKVAPSLIYKYEI